VVAASASGAPTRWWILESADPDEPDGGYGEQLRSPPLAIDDAPPGPDRQEPTEPEGAFLLTPDPGLPVFAVRYHRTEAGANSGVELTRHLLIDWRKEPPRVTAVLDVVDGWSGGGCGAPDAGYDTSMERGCRWDPWRLDFLCAGTIHRADTRWGERRGSRFFYLDSEERVPAPHVPRYPDLGSFASLMVPGDQEIRTLDGHGDTAAVQVVGFGKSRGVLLAAPSLSRWFGVRLHAALIDERGIASVHEIVPREHLGPPAIARPQRHTADDVSSRDEGATFPTREALAAFTPDGMVPHLESRELTSSKSLHVLELRVTEGEARGLYLVGLELVNDRLVADALLVATDALTYSDCNTWTAPASAVSMAVVSTPTFATTLDVEPANVEDEEGNLQRPEGGVSCGAMATVHWEHGAGFAVEWQRRPCIQPELPRRVVFDREGGLPGTRR
jgi:hypothetical protein